MALQTTNELFGSSLLDSSSSSSHSLSSFSSSAMLARIKCPNCEKMMVKILMSYCHYALFVIVQLTSYCLLLSQEKFAQCCGIGAPLIFSSCSNSYEHCWSIRQREAESKKGSGLSEMIHLLCFDLDYLHSKIWYLSKKTSLEYGCWEWENLPSVYS